MDEYRVVIAGSRSFTQFDLGLQMIKDATASIFDYAANKPVNEPLVFLSGQESGANQLSYMLSEQYDIKTITFAPEEGSGVFGGYTRNRQMLDYADSLIVFWDEQCRNTKHVIEHAQFIGIPYKLITHQR